MKAALKKAPMFKKHEGIGNHKQRMQSHAAVKANASGSGLLHSGQADKKEPGKKS